MPSAPTRNSLLEKIPNDVAAIFQQAQVSGLNHHKNCIALHGIHKAAAEIGVPTKRGFVKLVGEKEFLNSFRFNLLCVLKCRKGDRWADLAGKFVGVYTRHVNERALAERQEELEEDDDSTEDDETYGSRFTAAISKELLRGFSAKEKNVRYRCMHILSEMVQHLGEIEFDFYKQLRTGFMGRLKDKEPTVRALAASCVGILCKDEIPEDIEEDEVTVEDAFLEILSSDDKSEVRKAILSNIPIKPMTIPHIVARGRDTDPNIRKLVFNNVLKKGLFIKPTSEGESTPGLTHPRELSIEHMETIINTGVRDRDPGVRTAATSLINEWVKCYEDEVLKPEPDSEDIIRIEHGVISLLEKFDVTNRNTEQLDVVERMLKVIFNSRPEISDGLEFEETYWQALGPENALLSRVFVEHCKDKKEVAKLEDILPVVGLMAICAESHYAALINVYNQEMFDDDVKSDLRAREFILKELLKFSALLDYADQFGYKQMLPIIKRMLEENELPDSLLPSCLDVLFSLSANEQDFVRIAVEIIQELRETYADEQAQVAGSAISEEQQEILDEANARCLKMTILTLKQIRSPVENNPTLEGIARDVIFPNLGRSDDGNIATDAITSVGLYALLDKRIAPTVLKTCFKQLNDLPPEADPVLLVTLFHTIFDLITSNGTWIMKFDDPSGAKMEENQDFLIEQIGKHYDMSVLVVICEGLAKMIMEGQLPQPTALINLFKAYITPDTQDCQQLVQCLSYFFNVYAHSTLGRKKNMQRIFTDVFKSVAIDRKELRKKDEEDRIISSSMLCKQYAEWTNPEESARKSTTAEPKDYSIHLFLAHDILKELFEKETRFEKEDKKALLQMLLELYLPDPEHADELMLANIKLLIETLKTRHPPKELASGRLLDRFQKKFTEQYAAQLENISEDEYRKWEELHDLFKFLDDIFLDDDDEFVDGAETSSRGLKRRSRSMATSRTSDNEWETPAERGRQTKRARYSNDDEEGGSSRRGTRHPSAKEEPVDPVLPKKKRRSALPKTPAPEPEVIVISSDDDEEPVQPGKPKARYRPRPSLPISVKQEEEREEDIDADLSALLRSQAISGVTQDSLFSGSDSEDEDEEDEVNSILAR